MKALIVEDETVAAENLTYLLRKVAPDIEIVAYSESVESTVEWLSSHQVDVIFMDIHLSDGLAFAIFEMLKVTTPIVFTTAYDRYALEAFRVNSIDYLLKPVKQDELQRALDKLHQRSPEELIGYISRLNALTVKPQYPCRLLVQEREHIHPIDVTDICCIYSTNKHTVIIMKSGMSYAVSKSLEQMMSTLDPRMFFRANKQFIIARSGVSELTVWFDSRLKITMVVDTPEPLYVSKNRVTEFKEWLVSD